MGDSNLLGIPKHQSPARSILRLRRGNGYGSTNTRVRRFTNVDQNEGAAMRYIDDAALGGTIFINERGLYSFLFSDVGTGGQIRLGFSLNSTEGGTDINLIGNNLSKLALTITSAANQSNQVTVTILLNPGDYIYPHTDAGGATNNDNTFLIAVKVAD